MWKSTILPVFMQKQTVLIALSTMLDSRAFFSRLVVMKHPETGDPVCNVQRLGKICKECRKTDTPYLCEHKIHKTVPWKSRDKMEVNNMLYDDNDMHQNLRENYGEIAGASRGALPAGAIERFKKLAPIEINVDPPVIY